MSERTEGEEMPSGTTGPADADRAAPTSTPLDALLAEMDKILSATPNPTTEPFTAGFNVATYQWAEHLRIIMAASPASALVTGENK
jgi:hypothetical protein